MNFISSFAIHDIYDFGHLIQHFPKLQHFMLRRA